MSLSSPPSSPTRLPSAPLHRMPPVDDLEKFQALLESATPVSDWETMTKRKLFKNAAQREDMINGGSASSEDDTPSPLVSVRVRESAPNIFQQGSGKQGKHTGAVRPASRAVSPGKRPASRTASPEKRPISSSRALSPSKSPRAQSPVKSSRMMYVVGNQVHGTSDEATRLFAADPNARLFFTHDVDELAKFFKSLAV
ncbi:hypothetical protein FB45DRAFT_910052 [Roridomyces roridus]|uniref:Uncharacterized protein n=1 Tax=Roridomyces roridus TaxID=1738132 RepID=A0AAD7FRB4_9AGAR|nr:hypothetical protein FB45DRAFT_910052 [Roridomyces roridus]